MDGSGIDFRIFLVKANIYPALLKSFSTQDYKSKNYEKAHSNSVFLANKTKLAFVA